MSPLIIGQAGHRSSSFHLGILALEKYIRPNADVVVAAPTGGRSKKSQASQAVAPAPDVIDEKVLQAWEQLVILNGDIDEVSVVQVKNK